MQIRTSEGKKKLCLPVTAFVSYKYFLKYFLADESHTCLACILYMTYKKDVERCGRT